MPEGWSQEVFDRTLKDYLIAHEVEVWPRAINEKASNVAYKAAEETPVKEIEIIETELQREVIVGSWQDRDHTKSRQDRPVAIGYAIASKRASKDWSYYLNTSNPTIAIRGRFGTVGVDAWRLAVAKKYKTMLGGRGRAAGFLALGWLQVVRGLRPYVRRSAGPAIAAARPYGNSKGEVTPATPENLLCTIENLANAKSEQRGGFERIGNAALQRAFDREMANMESYLDGEMRPEAEKFNARQN